MHLQYVWRNGALSLENSAPRPSIGPHFALNLLGCSFLFGTSVTEVCPCLYVCVLNRTGAQVVEVRVGGEKQEGFCMSRKR